MNSKKRKEKIQELMKKAELEAVIKKASQEADEQSADAADYSEKLFNNLVDSIKIDGLED